MTRWLQLLLGKGKSFPGLGKDAYVDPTVQITGRDHVQIGEGVIIGESSWLNVNDRTPGTKSIVIGDFAFVGRRAFFACGSRISLGPYCVLGPDCHFIGNSHNFSDPFEPYLTTGVTSGGAIEIGANCFIGARTTFLAECRVGFGSVIGAGSVVRGEIPPLSMAVGNPARIVKRFDPASRRWVRIADWPVDSVLPTEEAYLASLAEKDWKARRYARGSAIAASSRLGDL